MFIWDMDETLIVFQSLVSGSYMNSRRMTPEKQALGKRLGMQMMKLILCVPQNPAPTCQPWVFRTSWCAELGVPGVAAGGRWTTPCFSNRSSRSTVTIKSPLLIHLFKPRFKRGVLIEQVDKHHVRSLDKFDDQVELRNYDFSTDRFSVYDGRGGRPACDLRKLAYRYRRVRDIYAQRREGTMNRKILAELIDAYQQTDAFSNGWLSLAKRMLHKVSLIPGAVNIVVSACQLTPTLAKSLVYQVSVMAYSCNPYGESLVQL